MRIEWMDEKRTNASIAALPEWVESKVHDAQLDFRNADDMDRFLLSTKPSQRAIRYTRVNTFGKHFRVEDDSTIVGWHPCLNCR